MIIDIKIKYLNKYLAAFNGNDEYCMWTRALLIHVCSSKKEHTQHIVTSQDFC